MIVAPDGKITADIGMGIGAISADVDERWKYMRPAGFGSGMVYNDDFISDGCLGNVFITEE